MATAESVKAKLQGLIDAANATTGGIDADLTAAVQSLIAGFGQGGGTGNLTIVSGTFTPAENTNDCRITGLAGSPSAFALAPAFSDQEAYNGVSKLLGFLWVRGVWGLFRTNAGGTSWAADNCSFNLESFTIEEDNSNVSGNNGKVLALKTGFLAYRIAYYFRAGLTYNWVAII